MSKKIVIAAGGTGGHLFPAQVVAQELQQELPGSSFLFLAKGLSTNPRFSRSDFCYEDIPASGVSLKTIVQASIDIPRGVLRSMRRLKEFSADVVIGFGSFHTFPVLIAAVLLGIPIILHVADSIPGRVNRLFSSQAAWNGIFFPDAAAFLRGTIKKTSLPLRKGFYPPFQPSRKSALEYYGLDEEKKTFLVFGGSQGAQKMNYLVSKALLEYPKKNAVQILHFTGVTSSEIASSYAASGIHAVVRPFEPQMHYAWAVADLVVARSGASTIAEQMAFAVPAIYLPYPHAKDQHQQKNAAFVENSIKSAKTLEEGQFTQHAFLSAVEMLLSEDIGSRMRENLRFSYANMQQIQFSKQIREFLVR